jgi:hypothetical protein
VRASGSRWCDAWSSGTADESGWNPQRALVRRFLSCYPNSRRVCELGRPGRRTVDRRTGAPSDLKGMKHAQRVTHLRIAGTEAI